MKLRPEFVAEICQILEAKDVDEPHDDDGVKVEEEVGGERAPEDGLKVANRFRKRTDHEVDYVRNLKEDSTLDDGPAGRGDKHVDQGPLLVRPEPLEPDDPVDEGQQCHHDED